ncbi:CHAP domain-containing protein [Acidocella aromatica]|uniref:Surface antigen n=1 Tax=Acidocella aromatica TaxID=1303579 RepID=A0A840VUC5_9PROT|nr:CHAP domain-containing protein [Acidocella aromatica]MBB5373802.1 surface antigen [Acidocella aromatica]
MRQFMGGKTTPCSLSGLARKALMGVSVSVACLASSNAAMASTHHKSSHSAHTTHHAVASTGHARHVASSHKTSHNHTVAASYHSSHVRLAQYRHSGLQCVPYAREVSHIELSGNAYLWWAEAAGRYARGNQPQEGAVLNFRSIGRMPLGHVAVVTAVMDSRTILITQANWVRGTITNDVTVQDVSANNDWSQVKVELGDSSNWGAPYPTYGFIYNRPDTGVVVASNGQGNEVAEAPAATQVSNEAPNRNLQ